MANSVQFGYILAWLHSQLNEFATKYHQQTLAESNDRINGIIPTNLQQSMVFVQNITHFVFEQNGFVQTKTGKDQHQYFVQRICRLVYLKSIIRYCHWTFGFSHITLVTQYETRLSISL